MNVTPGRYILGIASLAVVCAAMAFAGVALRRRLAPEWTGAVDARSWTAQLQSAKPFCSA